MIQTIRKIGNSKGVLLPKGFNQSLGDQDQVVMIQTPDGILIKPLHARYGWEGQFNAVAKSGVMPDGDLFDSLPNKFDSEEWPQ